MIFCVARMPDDLPGGHLMLSQMLPTGHACSDLASGNQHQLSPTQVISPLQRYIDYRQKNKTQYQRHGVVYLSFTFLPLSKQYTLQRA